MKGVRDDLVAVRERVVFLKPKNVLLEYLIDVAIEEAEASIKKEEADSRAPGGPALRR